MKLIFSLIKLCIFLIVIFFILLFYAFKIEPYLLNIDIANLDTGNDNSENLKIVQFSDTHIKEDYTIKELEKIVTKINSLNPDIVIFTGDLYDDYSVYNDDENIINCLSKIDAKIEKIAITGNRDYGGNAYKKYDSIMENSGFILLINQNLTFKTFNNKKVLITGLDDSLLGSPNLPTTNYEGSDYNILISHEPDVVDNYHVEKYDLILSGHTHGGQLNIPFISDMLMNNSDIISPYKGGLIKIDDTNNTYLYVNTGLGTTHISARFLVPPTITEFNISI